MQKIIFSTILTAFLATAVAPPGFAQMSQGDMPFLPEAGAMVPLSAYNEPARMVGLELDPKNPFKLNFIIDQGPKPLSDEIRKQEFQKLINYFLVSLTVPNNDMWVNLSPYEQNRIIPNDFSKTAMGRDLLAEDYILKQITASTIYPEGRIGKEFWAQVYHQAAKEFGTTNVPVNTYNKVWIVPDKAVIYEKNGTALLMESHLKVMLEEDYLSLTKHTAISNSVIPDSTPTIGSQVIRKIVIPLLEKEVNEGKNFAPLRQAYSAMLMATYFKRALRQSILGQIYADKDKVLGVDLKDSNAQKEKIYQQYLKAYKKGVFNYIKEDVDTISQQIIPRKYFSGGVVGFNESSLAMVGEPTPEGKRLWQGFLNPAQTVPRIVSTSVVLIPVDQAMKSNATDMKEAIFWAKLLLGEFNRKPEGVDDWTFRVFSGQVPKRQLSDVRKALDRGDWEEAKKIFAAREVHQWRYSLAKYAQIGGDSRFKTMYEIYQALSNHFSTALTDTELESVRTFIRKKVSKSVQEKLKKEFEGTSSIEFNSLTGENERTKIKNQLLHQIETLLSELTKDKDYVLLPNVVSCITVFDEVHTGYVGTEMGPVGSYVFKVHFNFDFAMKTSGIAAAALALLPAYGTSQVYEDTQAWQYETGDIAYQHGGIRYSIDTKNWTLAIYGNDGRGHEKIYSAFASNKIPQYVIDGIGLFSESIKNSKDRHVIRNRDREQKTLTDFLLMSHRKPRANLHAKPKQKPQRIGIDAAMNTNPKLQDLFQIMNELDPEEIQRRLREIFPQAGIQLNGNYLYLNRSAVPNPDELISQLLEHLPQVKHRLVRIMDFNTSQIPSLAANNIVTEDTDSQIRDTPRRLTPSQQEILFSSFDRREGNIFHLDHHYDYPALATTSTTPILLDYLKWLHRKPYGSKKIKELQGSFAIMDHSDADILLANYLITKAGDLRFLDTYGDVLAQAALLNDYAINPTDNRSKIIFDVVSQLEIEIAEREMIVPRAFDIIDQTIAFADKFSQSDELSLAQYVERDDIELSDQERVIADYFLNGAQAYLKVKERLQSMLNASIDNLRSPDIVPGQFRIMNSIIFVYIKDGDGKIGNAAILKFLQEDHPDLLQGLSAVVSTSPVREGSLDRTIKVRSFINSDGSFFNLSRGIWDQFAAIGYGKPGGRALAGSFGKEPFHALTPTDIEKIVKTIDVIVNHRAAEVNRAMIIEKTEKDAAMNGGIDFNSANLNLLIKRDSQGMPLPTSLQDLAQLSRIRGFKPKILSIQPAANLPVLKELQQKLQL